MRKTILITLMTVLSGFLIGFACSLVGTMGYVAAQGLPTVTPSLTVMATSWPATTVTPPPTTPEIPTATPRPTKTPTPNSADIGDPEAEYYRAIFDVCMYSARKADISKERAVEGCRLFTRQTMQQKRFKEPSQEWEWPLPATESLASPSA